MQPHLIQIRATGIFYPAAAHSTPNPVGGMPGMRPVSISIGSEMSDLCYSLEYLHTHTFPLASCCTASHQMSEDANAENLLGLVRMRTQVPV